MSSPGLVGTDPERYGFWPIPVTGTPTTSTRKPAKRFERAGHHPRGPGRRAGPRDRLLAVGTPSHDLRQRRRPARPGVRRLLRARPGRVQRTVARRQRPSHRDSRAARSGSAPTGAFPSCASRPRPTCASAGLPAAKTTTRRSPSGRSRAPRTPTSTSAVAADRHRRAADRRAGSGVAPGGRVSRRDGRQAHQRGAAALRGERGGVALRRVGARRRPSATRGAVGDWSTARSSPTNTATCAAGSAHRTSTCPRRCCRVSATAAAMGSVSSPADETLRRGPTRGALPVAGRLPRAIRRRHRRGGRRRFRARRRRRRDQGRRRRELTPLAPAPGRWTRTAPNPVQMLAA